MDIADWKGFPARRRAAKKRGKLLGLGLANYVESSIGAPREQARIKVQPQDQSSPAHVDVVIGTQPAGQGHETSFAQVISDLLRVPAESVRIILGDTDVVRVGGGSHSGRSMRHAATVFSKAAVDLIAQGQGHRGGRADGSAGCEFLIRRRPLCLARDQSHLRFPRTGRRKRRATSFPRRSRTASRSSPTTRCTSRSFPTARRSARSRSIPIPARCRSCAMPRSTTSAAASIR